MSIANNLSNHVDSIRRGLSTLSLRTPDRVQQILDTRARYQTGIAKEGYSLTYLRNTPSSLFYRGADSYQAQEADPQTERILVPWTNMMTPIQFLGTDLEEMRGIRADRLTDDDFTLSDFDGDSRDNFLDWIGTNVKATASRQQNARVMSLWGRGDGLDIAPGDRQPISLGDIFNESTGLYNAPVTALGTFEAGHPWHSTASPNASGIIPNPTKKEDAIFGNSRPYKMTPREYYFSNYDNNGIAQGAPDAAPFNATTDLEKLYDIIGQYSQVVPGTKVAVCDNKFFSKLAFAFRNSDKFPLLVGTDKWKFQIRCVVMEDCYFISDPNKRAEENSIYFLHIGDGDDGGTVFPLYWQPDMSVRESVQSAIEDMIDDPPDGMAFGPRRTIPFYLDKFVRMQGMADAVGGMLRLKQMTVVTEPWCQLHLRNIMG